MPPGYGTFWDGDHHKAAYAHRYGYELLHGLVPKGLVVDHNCHNLDLACVGGITCLHRRCQSPAHLRLVTPLENFAAGRDPHRKKTHCKRGHELTPENTYVFKSGNRLCKICASWTHHVRYFESERHLKAANPRGALANSNFLRDPDLPHA